MARAIAPRGRSKSEASSALTTESLALDTPRNQNPTAISNRLNFYKFGPAATKDAWIDHEKTKVGYEIPFNRHFYVFKPPRPIAEIDAELKGVTDRILAMIGGLTK